MGPYLQAQDIAIIFRAGHCSAPLCSDVSISMVREHDSVVQEQGHPGGGAALSLGAQDMQHIFPRYPPM